jgi:hypothetical protein
MHLAEGFDFLDCAEGGDDVATNLDFETPDNRVPNEVGQITGQLFVSLITDG